MKLIVGLGNPGEKYKDNRHNVGRLVLDRLKQEISKSEIQNPIQIPVPDFKSQKKLQSLITIHQSLILAKPQTYMNSSGFAVSKIVNHYKINMADLWVIHDDLDLHLGEYKIQFGKGPKIHKGVLSIEEKLGDKDFWRVRVGVDNRGTMLSSKLQILGGKHKIRIPGEQYVLCDFNQTEVEGRNLVITKVVEELRQRLKI